MSLTFKNRMKIAKNKTNRRGIKKVRKLNKRHTQRNYIKDITRGLTMKRRNFKGGIKTDGNPLIKQPGALKNRAIEFNTNIKKIDNLSLKISIQLNNSLAMVDYKVLKENFTKVNDFLKSYNSDKSTPTKLDKLIDKSDKDIMKKIQKRHGKNAVIIKDVEDKIKKINPINKTYLATLDSTNNIITSLKKLYKSQQTKRQTISNEIKKLSDKQPVINKYLIDLPNSILIKEYKNIIDTIKTKLGKTLALTKVHVTIGNNIINPKLKYLTYDDLYSYYSIQIKNIKTSKDNTEAARLVKKNQTLKPVGVKPVGPKPVGQNPTVSGNNPIAAAKPTVSGNNPIAAAKPTVSGNNPTAVQPNKLTDVENKTLEALLKKQNSGIILTFKEKQDLYKLQTKKRNLVAKPTVPGNKPPAAQPDKLTVLENKTLEALLKKQDSGTLTFKEKQDLYKLRTKKRNLVAKPTVPGIKPPAAQPDKLTVSEKLTLETLIKKEAAKTITADEKIQLAKLKAKRDAAAKPTVPGIKPPAVQPDKSTLTQAINPTGAKLPVKPVATTVANVDKTKYINLMKKYDNNTITPAEKVKLTNLIKIRIAAINKIPNKQRTTKQRSLVVKLMGIKDKLSNKQVSYSTKPGLPTKDRTISINITLPEHFYVAQNDQGQNDASTSISEVMSQLNAG